MRKRVNTKICPECGTVNLKIKRRCSSCGIQIGTINWSMGVDSGKRNAGIIAALQTGKFTLQEIATVEGVSRERIRQIFTKYTGKPMRVRIEMARLTELKAMKAEAKKIKFNCIACGRAVTYGEGSHRWYYCAEHAPSVKGADGKWHTTRSRRDYRSPRFCKCCGKTFYPWLNWRSASTNGGQFCEMKCYIDYRRAHLPSVSEGRY